MLTDALAGDLPVRAGNAEGRRMAQSIDVYASNPDFVWKTEYPVPRYGQGAFLECLRSLWRCRSGGQELRLKEFGKPHKVQFDAARNLFCVDGTGASGPPRRLYMIGDNPASDIRGANAAGQDWRSILVCTGVYSGGPHGNDPQDPAWRVEPDLRSAVERLVRACDAEHLTG